MSLIIAADIDCTASVRNGLHRSDMLLFMVMQVMQNSLYRSAMIFLIIDADNDGNVGVENWLG